jgi:hypothetical protein
VMCSRVCNPVRSDELKSELNCAGFAPFPMPAGSHPYAETNTKPNEGLKSNYQIEINLSSILLKMRLLSIASANSFNLRGHTRMLTRAPIASCTRSTKNRRLETLLQNENLVIHKTLKLCMWARLVSTLQARSRQAIY